MSEKKPAAFPPLRERPNCPVCGKVSYSLGGMHPQCAVVRADASLQASRKAKKEVAAPRGGFTKRCRGCGRTVPARRMVCDCGRSFARIAPAGGGGIQSSLSGAAKTIPLPEKAAYSSSITTAAGVRKARRRRRRIGPSPSRR